MSDHIDNVKWVATVPKLKNNGNFLQWRRAIHNHLLINGCLGIVEGTDVEPFRRAADETARSVRAGSEVPTEVEELVATGQAATRRPLTESERKEWRAWAVREQKVQGILQMTVSDGLAGRLYDKKSAKEMWDHLAATHKVATPQHRNTIRRQLYELLLREDPTPDDMTKHLERFETLVMEAKLAGDDTLGDEVQLFLNTLPESFSALQIQLSVSDEKDWDTLLTLWGIESDRRARLRQRRQASAQAMASIARPGNNNQGGGGGKGGKGGKGKGGGAKGDGNGRDMSTVKCYNCNNMGHFSRDCPEPQRPRNNGGTDNANGGTKRQALATANGQGNAYIGVSVDDASVFGAIRLDPTTTWVVDSGATHHLTCDRSILSNVRTLDQPFTFNLASRATMESLEVGEVHFRLASGRPVILQEVYYVPVARVSLLSLRRMVKRGWEVSLGEGGGVIRQGSEVLRVEQRETLWTVTMGQLGQQQSGEPTALTIHPSDTSVIPHNDIDTPPHESPDLSPSPVALAVEPITSMSEAHERLGHIGAPKIRQMISAGLLRIVYDDFRSKTCDTCQIAKSQRQAMTNEAVKAQAPCDIIHVDIAGPFLESKEGNLYYVAAIDGYTKINMITPIRARSDSARCRHSSPVSRWRLGEMCGRSGPIWAESSIVGRRRSGMRTLKGDDCCHDPRISGRSCLLGLRRSIRLGDPEPHDRFGTDVFIHLPAETRNKASFSTPKAIRGRVIGLDQDSTGYLVLDENEKIHRTNDISVQSPRNGKSVTHRNRVSDPDSNPDSTPDSDPDTPNPNDEELIHLDIYDDLDNNDDTDDTVARSRGEEAQPRLPSPSSDNGENNGDDDIPEIPPPPTIQRAPSTRHRQLPAYLNDYVGITEHYGPNAEAAYLATEAAMALAITPAEDEPSTFAQATRADDSEEWYMAMEKELSNIISKGTWEETQLPPGRKAIGCRWVYKKKRDAEGRVVKYKARLVAKGYSQVPGIDFEETYAPVGRTTSLRILLAIAAATDLEIHQADVEGAYLNGRIEEEIYMSFPDGYQADNHETNALRLRGSLYGLKQSGRTWWIELGEGLAELGFNRLQSDWGLYYRPARHGRPAAILLAYVDDIVIATRYRRDIDEIMAGLKKRWAMTEMGEISHILGLKVTRDRATRRIWLSQPAYIDTLHQRFPINGKSSPTPLSIISRIQREARSQPAPTEAAPRCDRTSYQEIVGCLQWLATCTRPDISFAAGYLARFTADPLLEHLHTAHHVLRYLYDTRDLGITLGGRRSTLEGWVDADWAGCLETRKSTTGYVFKINGSPVVWSSRRQKTVATSTVEAEYIAGAEAAAEAHWLRTLLGEIEFKCETSTVLHIDNQGALRLALNPGTHTRTKHIDIKHHKLREYVASGTITLHYIPTADQQADILTKALPGPRHSANMQELGMAIPGGAWRALSSRGSVSTDFSEPRGLGGESLNEAGEGARDC